MKAIQLLPGSRGPHELGNRLSEIKTLYIRGGSLQLSTKKHTSGIQFYPSDICNYCTVYSTWVGQEIFF